MEDKKAKAGSIAVGICLFVIAILLVLIVVFFYNTTTEKNNLQTKASDLQTTIEEKEKKVNELENKISKVSDAINGEEDNELIIPSVYTADTKNLLKNVNYDLAVGDEYYSISTRNNKITFTFSKDEKELKQLADFFKIDEKDIKVEPHKGIEVIGFSKKVVDVEIGCLGQDSTLAIFIFLMEDGTVEYSDVKNMLTKASTQGKIDGLKDVIRLQTVDVWAPEDGGHVSMIAIDKDNVCYDISDYINNEETSIEDIILEGTYVIDASELGYEFYKDGRVESSSLSNFQEGFYYTIDENTIEMKFNKEKVFDPEQNIEDVDYNDINEIYIVTIKDENTLHVKGVGDEKKYEFELIKY